MPLWPGPYSPLCRCCMPMPPALLRGSCADSLLGRIPAFCSAAGKGVYGFTFDPLIGEYILSHPDIKIPEKGGCRGLGGRVVGWAGWWSGC